MRLLMFKFKQSLHQHLFGASTPVRAVPEVAAGRQITADKPARQQDSRCFVVAI